MALQRSDEIRGEILSRVEEGMDVFDRDGRKIGIVKYIQNGLGLVEEVSDSPALPSNAPLQICRQLMQRGFIKIKAGLLVSDRFATADQVERVEDDRVALNVSDDELLKM
jgi:hypothetical protein